MISSISATCFSASPVFRLVKESRGIIYCSEGFLSQH